MFSRKEQLIQKTGETGVGRYEFLSQLINEFTTTKSTDARNQTLANLANFAYDPINYDYIKQLHLIDLFLAQLSEASEELIHFSLAGICNLCCDPESRDYIFSLNGVSLVTQYLGHKNEDIALNALTTLFYLFDGSSAIIPESLIPKVLCYQNSNDARYRNLGQIFLETYFTPQQISEHKS